MLRLRTVKSRLLRPFSRIQSQWFSDVPLKEQSPQPSSKSWSWKGIGGAIVIGTSAVLIPSIATQLYQSITSDNGNSNDQDNATPVDENVFAGFNVNPQFLLDAQALKGVYLWGNFLPAFLKSEKEKDSPIVSLKESKLLRTALGVKGLTGLVNSNGDLIQVTEAGTVPILSGFGAEQVSVSTKQKSFFVLSRSGKVVRVLAVDPKLSETNKISSHCSSWTSYIFGPSLPKNAFYVEAPPLRYSERITRISAQDSQVTAITSHGRLLTAPLSSSTSQIKFSLLEGKDSYKTLKDIFFDDLVSGDSHTLLKSRDGRVFGMGSNHKGQLGFSQEKMVIDMPTEIDTIWRKDGRPQAKPNSMTCTRIAAGADSSLFGVYVAADDEDKNGAEIRIVGTGAGQFGQLGNGSFSNMAFHPVQVRKISSMKEYDEKSGRVVPVDLKSLKVGPSGTCLAVLSGGQSSSGEKVCDVLVWGSNQQGLLRRIDGKGGNTSSPLWMKAINYHRANGNTDINETSSTYRLALLENQDIALLDGYGMIFSHK